MPQITVSFSRGTKPFDAHVAYTNFENADFDFLPFASLGEPNKNYTSKTLFYKDEILKRLPVKIQSKLSVAEFTLIFSEVQNTKNYGWLILLLSMSAFIIEAIFLVNIDRPTVVPYKAMDSVSTLLILKK